MNLKGISALFVLFLLMSSLYAQVKELTIEDAVQLAKENNISVKSLETHWTIWS